MATREVSEWEKVDASNNFPVDEGGWAEGMKRSDVNDASRANMGSVRRWYDAPEWLDLTGGGAVTRISDTQFTVPGDFASYFNDGRRLKFTGGSTDPWYATVDEDAAFVVVTTVDLKDFSSGTGIPTVPSPTLVFLNIIADTSLGDQILITVPILTGVAIQAAIDEAEDAGGGIIVLEPAATYVVDAQINIGLGDTPGNIRILGRGATLKSDIEVDDSLLEIREGGAADTDMYVTIEDVTFDGDAATQTGGDGLGMVTLGGNVSYVTFRNCGFNDSHSHGLRIRTNCHNVWVVDCVFNDCGENCIRLADAASEMTEIYIRGCTFSNPAARSTVTQGAAIRFSGKINISDCQIANLNHATDTQIGIWAAPKAASSPIDQSGHDSTISGITISGTGLNSRGIYCEGRNNAFSNFTITLTGAGSEGIQVSQSFGGGVANHNTFNAIHIIDAETGIKFETDAEDNIANACNITSSPHGYKDAGKRNLFTGCRIDASTDGVTIEAAAVDATVLASLITGSSSEGVVVVAGALRTQLLLNAVTNSTTADYVDGGTLTGIAKVEHFFNQLIFPASGSHDAVTLDESDGTEYPIPDSETVFGIYADGVNVWVIEQHSILVQVKFTNQVADRQVRVRLKFGDNRLLDPTNDVTISTAATVQSTGVDPTSIVLSMSLPDPFFIVPDVANDDELYLTAERLDGINTSDVDIEIVGEDTFGEGTYILTRLREQND